MTAVTLYLRGLIFYNASSETLGWWETMLLICGCPPPLFQFRRVTKQPLVKLLLLPACRGIKLEINIAKILDAPLTVGPDHVLAVVKVYEEGEGGVTIHRSSWGFYRFWPLKELWLNHLEQRKKLRFKKNRKRSQRSSPGKILHSWLLRRIKSGSFNYPKEKKKISLAMKLNF